jgi:peptidoglycan hydrolase-like protein with peptidoglycan-binding domain
MLKSLGFNCADTKGTYGTKTVAAVKAFQEKYGLLIDGIYDKTTASILEDIYSRKAEK